MFFGGEPAILRHRLTERPIHLIPSMRVAPHESGELRESVTSCLK
jgi:hypothetical protein